MVSLSKHCIVWNEIILPWNTHNMCIYIIYKPFLPGTLPPLFCRGAVGVDDVLDVVESLGQRVEAIRDTNQLLAILWTKSYDNNYHIIIMTNARTMFAIVEFKAHC